jgi:gliding motility-associated-like protein
MVALVATASPEAESFEWKVDGNVRSDVSGNEFVYELPAKVIDYRSTISVQTSYPTSCFERTLPATDEITILIRNCDSAVPDTTLHVPTAFTPNRDGKNDQWEFYNLSAFPGLKIDVFSRWGEVIFHSENYTVPWDGSYKGKTVSPGTYPYQISYEGNLIKQGTVTVIH